MLVSVTETDTSALMSPSIVKGASSRNWLPYDADAVVLYQLLNSVSTLTCTTAVARLVPVFPVKLKFAWVTAWMLENPMMTISNPDEVREAISTREIRGARRRIAQSQTEARLLERSGGVRKTCHHELCGGTDIKRP